MKTILVVLLLCVSLAANVVLWRRINALELKSSSLVPKSYPLGEMMGYLQRYTDKLWFAGNAGNWELARFYHDEVAETADDIAAAHVVDEGIEVSRQLGQMLRPVLGRLDQAIAAKDPAQLTVRYRELIETCNACHAATKHGFIQVAVPAGPPTHWNQRFAPP